MFSDQKVHDSKIKVECSEFKEIGKIKSKFISLSCNYLFFFFRFFVFLIFTFCAKVIRKDRLPDHLKSFHPGAAGMCGSKESILSHFKKILQGVWRTLFLSVVLQFIFRIQIQDPYRVFDFY